MQRRNIHFPDPLVADAEKIAEKKGVKFTDVVRSALERYVAEEKKASGLK